MTIETAPCSVGLIQIRVICFRVRPLFRDLEERPTPVFGLQESRPFQLMRLIRH